MNSIVAFFIRAFARISGKLSMLVYQIVFANIELTVGVRFIRIPSVFAANSCKIILKENVVLNSLNFGYHLNMFSKVKLLADGNNSKIIVGKKTRIHGSCIHAQGEIIIGENCLIAANCQIMDSNAHELSMQNPSNRMNTIDKPRKIEIGNNVWLGTGCIILPGTKIGDGSVIAANSVVNGEVPANCLFGGNPAKLLKQY